MKLHDKAQEKNITLAFYRTGKTAKGNYIIWYETASNIGRQGCGRKGRDN
jgi:hypothetical protein